MTEQEATKLALGYAWAWEDATGTRTYENDGRVGPGEFAEAYAKAWQEYNNQEQSYIMPVSQAYTQWNKTSGKTVRSN